MALEVDPAQAINGRFVSILMMIMSNQKEPFRIGDGQQASTSRCGREESWGRHAYQQN